MGSKKADPIKEKHINLESYLHIGDYLQYFDLFVEETFKATEEIILKAVPCIFKTEKETYEGISIRPEEPFRTAGRYHQIGGEIKVMGLPMSNLQNIKVNQRVFLHDVVTVNGIEVKINLGCYIITDLQHISGITPETIFRAKRTQIEYVRKNNG